MALTLSIDDPWIEIRSGAYQADAERLATPVRTHKTVAFPAERPREQWPIARYLLGADMEQFDQDIRTFEPELADWRLSLSITECSYRMPATSPGCDDLYFASLDELVDFAEFAAARTHDLIKPV